ncbi:unnamed protein product [marine sediment metagenome]|uniref:Uncharacterized protein n=1 Tax=marine sediment metagenome TaxID=412755 RepID=X0UGU0_9ZZZZ
MSHVQLNKLVASSVLQKDVCEEGDFGDSEILIRNCKAGDTLMEFEIDINIPFDGTAPKASIGIDSNHEKYLTEDQCNITLRGTYVMEYTVILSIDETIKIYVTPDGSTQGTISGAMRFFDTEL